jgi:opacity protein-like surface antigen
MLTTGHRHSVLRQAFLLFVCINSSNAFSLPAALDNVDVAIAAGPTWYRASNGYTQALPYETDTNVVSGVSRTPVTSFGIGYHLFANKLRQRRFLNDLLVQLNWSHDSAALRGDYWQFGSHNANNFSFRAPMTSTRLMLDFKPTLFTWHQVSPYAVLGSGVAWNRMSLNTTATTPGYEPYQMNLPAATNRNWAYDTGFGLRVALNQHCNASLEYLATHLGRVAPGINSSVLSVPNFPLHSQSVLLGLSWKF